MKLLCISQVPTNWWPHRVICALWTRRPIAKVAMGCHTEPAPIHIAHVLEKMHFFQFLKFFINYITYHKKNFNLQDFPQNRKITCSYRRKKKHSKTILCTKLTFFTPRQWSVGDRVVVLAHVVACIGLPHCTTRIHEIGWGESSAAYWAMVRCMAHERRARERDRAQEGGEKTRKWMG